MPTRSLTRRATYIAQRVICVVVSIAIALQPMYQALLFGSVVGILSSPLAALAQTAPPPGAAEGKALGQSLLRGPSTDGTSIFYKGRNGAETINAGDLFQGAGSADDVQAMMDAFGDDNALNALAAAVAGRLGAEGSQQANAYQTVRESALSRSHPDMAMDPMFSRSSNLLKGDDPIFRTFFPGCTSTEVTTGGGTVHVPDPRYCSRVMTPVEQCEVSHAYEVNRLMRITGGQGTLVSCGPNCMEITVGTEENTHWRANCQIFEESLSVAIDTPDAITSATFTFSHYDDYLHFYVGNDRVFAGPDSNLPPETGGRCDRGNHDVSPNIDLTSYFQNNTALVLKNRVSVTVRGEAWVKIRVIYDPAKLVKVDQWTISPECQALITGIQDGACSAPNISCIDGPDTSVPCLTVGGVEVCQNMLAPSPVPGLSPLCRRGEITANCNFMSGSMQCWRDPNGVEHCPRNDGNQPNGCARFESDPKCAFVSSRCLPFALGPSGQCYAFEEKWDCGYDVGLPGGTTTRVSCDGPIRCMGEDCVSPTRETNPDFVKASAALSAMTFLSMEMNCADGNPDNCRIFGGEAMECKMALGGYQDCCNSPVSVGLADYLKLTMASYDLAKKLELGTKLANAGLNVPGAWNAVRNYASSTFSAITRPFTSAWGSLTQSYGGAAVDAIESFRLDALKQEMMNATAEFVGNTFGPEVASMFFTQTGTDAGGEAIYSLSENFATALNVIMWVYTIYLVLNILIDIIWACEEQEFVLAARREMLACTRIGTYCASDSIFGCIEKRDSYCCYNSPLARIVMEGAAPQLNLDLGSAQTPNCSGLTVAQLAALDWNQIDLNQWYGILAANGVIPNEAETFNTNYALENVTRNQRATFAAPNAPERIQAEVDAATYFDEAREKTRQDLWSGAR